MEKIRSVRPVLLVLTSTYPRWHGDPEPGFVHELSKRLVNRFKVIVLCPHAPGAAREEELDGVHVVRYRYAPTKLQRLVNDGGIITNIRRNRLNLVLVPGFVIAQGLAAWRLMREQDVAVIHAHWLLPQGLLAATIGLVRRKPLRFVVTSHGADLFSLRGALLTTLKRFVASRAARVTVVSKAMRDELASLGADPEKIVVRPMGVDLGARFIPDTTVERSRSELLFVGRLVEKKGIHHLIAALPEVLSRYPSTTLTIAGFGPEESALQALAQRLGLTSCVHFMGPVSQSDLPALYRRAALFVAPFIVSNTGDQEGLGLVVVEALGCGCPVLAGDVRAVRDLPVERIDPSDTIVFADRICAMLASQEALQAAGIEKRMTCVERFDWEKVARRYAEILEDTVARS